MSQYRINWIDWAKAIAIFAVVHGHLSRDSDPYWTVEVANLGRLFHVPLFFLVSGYLFRVKDDNFKDFVWYSIKSLIVPYLFFNFVSAAILWKLQSPEVYHNGLYGFLLVKGNAFAGPAWFLVVLFLIRLIAYGMEKLKSQQAQWGIFFAMIVVSAILPFKIHMGVSSAILSFPFFFGGHYFRQKEFAKKYIELPFIVKLISFLVLLLVCIILKDYSRSMDLGNAAFKGGSIVISYLFVALYVLMAVTFCILLNNIELKVIKTISAGCIVIMGFHMTIVQIFWAYSTKFPDIVSLLFKSPLLSIISFVLSLLIAIYLMRYTPFLIGNRK